MLFKIKKKKILDDTTDEYFLFSDKRVYRVIKYYMNKVNDSKMKVTVKNLILNFHNYHTHLKQLELKFETIYACTFVSQLQMWTKNVHG